MKKLRTIEIKELISPKEVFLNPEEDDEDGPQFALCSATRKQTTEFHYCREGLINEIYNFLSRSLYRNKKSKIDTRKMRLLITMPWTDYHYHEYYDSRYDKELTKARGKADGSMRIGLKLINHFEEMAKWPLTQLYRVSHRHLPSHVFMYLLIGSARWMRSPHMVSLFVLLARLGRISQFEKFRSHQKFLEICENLVERFDHYYNRGYGYDDDEIIDDVSHLKVIYDKIEVVMKHFNYLFGKRTPQYSFTKAVSKKLIFGEGIGRLCSKASGDPIVARKFEKLRKKYGR